MSRRRSNRPATVPSMMTARASASPGDSTAMGRTSGSFSADVAARPPARSQEPQLAPASNPSIRVADVRGAASNTNRAAESNPNLRVADVRVAAASNPNMRVADVRDASTTQATREATRGAPGRDNTSRRGRPITMTTARPATPMPTTRPVITQPAVETTFATTWRVAPAAVSEPSSTGFATYVVRQRQARSVARPPATSTNTKPRRRP